jgi:NAD(P)H-dependent FMN reductase
MTPRILVFAGSIRSGAYSGKTADAAMKELALLGAEVTRISLADYPLPIMDEDLEKAQGIPENAVKLGRMINAHDGMLIASPEYNSSIPPLLKNTIDWISRISSDQGKVLKPFDGKIVALCSSSPGAFAGIRGLYHLRSVMMNVGSQVITQQCSIGNAATAFDDDGALTNPRTASAMTKVCRELVSQAALLGRR